MELEFTLTVETQLSVETPSMATTGRGIYVNGGNAVISNNNIYNNGQQHTKW